MGRLKGTARIKVVSDGTCGPGGGTAIYLVRDGEEIDISRIVHAVQWEANANEPITQGVLIIPFFHAEIVGDFDIDMERLPQRPAGPPPAQPLDHVSR